MKRYLVILAVVLSFLMIPGAFSKDHPMYAPKDQTTAQTASMQADAPLGYHHYKY